MLIICWGAKIYVRTFKLNMHHYAAYVVIETCYYTYYTHYRNDYINIYIMLVMRAAQHAYSNYNYMYNVAI